MKFNTVSCRNFLITIIAVLLVGIYHNNPGYTQTKDLQLWSDIKLEVEVFKNISVEIEIVK